MVIKILLVFAVIAALDKIFGNKLRLGDEFEKGINMFGSLVLAMLGIMILVPVISEGLRQITWIMPDCIDFSIIPSAFVANDMGGAFLAEELSVNKEIGAFNGYVVSSMMGCTVVFIVPYSLHMTAKQNHEYVILGIVCGIITIPVGCIIAGIICGINFVTLIVNQLPLILFAAILAVGLLKWENITLKLMKAFGWFMQTLLVVGVVLGFVEFMTDIKLIPGIDTIENCIGTIVYIVGIMICALPILFIIKKLFAAPLKAMGKKLNINETSALGFITTLGTSLTTFEMANDMDKRGLALNSAFSVSASFALIDHFAFTMSTNPKYVVPVVVGKIISGIAAVVVAYVMLGRKSVFQNEQQFNKR